MIGPKGQILLTNRAASEILSKQDGLVATKAGLRAKSVSESAQLQKLIFQALETAVGKGVSPAGGLLVARQEGRPLQVLVTPSKGLPLNLNLGRPAYGYAVVLVTDPSQNDCPAPEVVDAFFDLTPAEYRVAKLLVEGKSPRDIAKCLNVSANTVKSQLASVYGKTGTTRQAELVRLLMKLPTSLS